MSQVHYDLEIHCFNQAPRKQVISAPSIYVGRANGDIVLGDPHASTPHAQFLVHEGVVWLRDSGSANGTFINGQRVTEVALSPGMTVQIGQSSVRLLAVYPAGAQSSAVMPPSGVAPVQEGTVPAQLRRRGRKKRSGGKKKWLIAALLMVVVLAGVPLLPHRVVASLDDEGEFLGSAIQWWHQLWRGDQMGDFDDWAYSACLCTEFTCMKAQSLEFLTLLEKYGDGKTISLSDAEQLQEFEKGAKCLSDIAIKTFEDQSAAMCACADAACAQREAAALDELLESAADLRSIGSADPTPAVKAAVASGTRCLNELAPPQSQGCLLFDKVSLGVKNQMAEITKNLPSAGEQVSYEKSALVFEAAAKDLDSQMLVVKDPRLKPLVQQLLLQLRAVAKSYGTRASLVAAGDTKATTLAEAKKETAALYEAAGKLNDEVYSVCHPESTTPITPDP